jgi:Protein of unknown function (DUF1501)
MFGPQMNRRQMLCQIGGGFGALGLATMLAGEGLLTAMAKAADAPKTPGGDNPLAPKPPHFRPRAKRVIFLFMNGGPSQVDTFDPKPAMEKYRGTRPEGAQLPTERAKGGGLLPSPFKFEKHGQSGIEVSELYPNVAKCIDDICVIRSMHTNTPNHEPSLLMMNSGETQPTRPSLGSWLTYGLGSENQNLPGYVVLCPGIPVVGPQLWGNSFLPGVFQGTHINNSNIDPKKIIQNVNNPNLPRSVQRQQLDLLQQMNDAHLKERGGDDQLEARIASLEIAFRMQFEAQEVFDLGRETAATRKAYGEGPFASACLMARRLAERGVRMTQVYYGNGQPWDDHADILNHRNHAKASDQAIAALLTDLKQTGLLDETLVLWGGEFGRTPTSEGQKGRDHNSKGFSMWLAGGGIKGGMVHGATDDFGYAAVEKPVHVHDLHATILHCLGIDHERLTFRYSGRDFRLTDVSGVVQKGILA